MLYRFTGNVEGQFAVHKTFDETVTIGNKVGAFVGDKHAVGVQFKPLFVTLVVVVVGGVRRNKQQRFVIHHAFRRSVNNFERFFVVVEVFHVETVVLLLGYVLFGLLPQRSHAVDRFPFHALFPIFFLFHLQFDGVAYVIGILLNKAAQCVLFQILGVVFLVGVRFQGERYRCSPSAIFGRSNFVPLCAATRPQVSLAVLFLRQNLHLVRHHKCRIKSHAELTDYFHVGSIFHALFECLAAAFSNSTEVVFQLVGAHAHTVVLYREGTCRFVCGNLHFQTASVQTGTVGKALIRQLIQSVACVGNKFTQENVLVGVDGVYHYVKYFLRFRFEFFHISPFLFVNFALALRCFHLYVSLLWRLLPYTQGNVRFFFYQPHDGR